MSEVADNATPAEEVAEKVAPVVEEAVVEEKAQSESKLEKFGQILEYAPDELKSAKTWDKFKDVDIPTALKAIVDMDKWTGKRGDIPDDKATPEQWKAFYEKLGVPKEAKEYTYALPDELKVKLGDEAVGIETYLGKAKEVAHKYNIPQKNLDGFLGEMMNYDLGLRDAGIQESTAAREAAQKMIDEAWGESFDEMSNAIQGIEKHYDFSPEATAIIENNPHLLIEFGKIAKDLDEKGQAGNAFSQTKIGLNDELADVEGQIKALLAKNKGNVKDPLIDPLAQRRARILQKIG